MDRISDSDSEGTGSIPVGTTSKNLNPCGHYVCRDFYFLGSNNIKEEIKSISSLY